MTRIREHTYRGKLYRVWSNENEEFVLGQDGRTYIVRANHTVNTTIEQMWKDGH